MIILCGNTKLINTSNKYACGEHIIPKVVNNKTIWDDLDNIDAIDDVELQEMVGEPAGFDENIRMRDEYLITDTELDKSFLVDEIPWENDEIPQEWKVEKL